MGSSLVSEQRPTADFVCPNCAEMGLRTMREGEVCRLCGEEAREPFREGWDESD
jgi:hypothetical protein